MLRSATRAVNPQRYQAAPYVLRFGEAHEPLPLRSVRPPRGGGRSAGRPPEPPFDFCAAMRCLCADIVTRVPALAHVDVQRVLFAFTQARSAHPHGLQARVTPLRFRAGRVVRPYRGVNYQVQRFVVQGYEVLYVMSFCLPRFLDQCFGAKLVTVFHELYHISPACNGDLRRYNGRCAYHTHSQKEYDQHMASLARHYLHTDPDPAVYHFLRADFAALRQTHGSVYGVVVPRPKILPL